MKYDFAAIEAKWQKKWEETKPYAAVTGDPRPKFYGLIEFPYPSAAVFTWVIRDPLRQWISSAAKSACRATMS